MSDLPIDDVTALEQRVRALEVERDQLTSELRDAREARQSALDASRAGEEILATITHDLRNPLSTIVMGATALLQMDSADDPRATRVRSIAERVHRQAERMTHQVANLGDLAAIQAGRLTVHRGPQQPATIIAAAGQLMAPVARERGLTFEAHAAADLVAVDCDAERVVQVLTNLINVAIKVTPRGGTIEVGARHDGSDIVFWVRDTGPGIPRDELAGLFGALWRSTQTSYKGAGLGFAIARGLVQAHDGQIWADSELGTGTTVFFSLATVAANPSR
ncbi:MAG TPA: HAMP domain-containing sensor histidine kinase [Kofleriaceae bacterium]